MQPQAFSQEKRQAQASKSLLPHGREKTFSVIEDETLMPSDAASTPFGAGAAFRNLRSHRVALPNRRLSMLGLMVTGVLHLLVGAALMLQSQTSKPNEPDPILFVQITEQKAVKPIETPPAPKLETPKVDVRNIRLPDIPPQQTNAITLPAKPMPAPPPASPDIKIVETYQLKLMQHLNTYKRYPSASRAQREEGVALLSFTIDQHGNVLAYRLARSSGHPRLDEETLALIQRASPVPAVPKELWRTPMVLVVPVDFSIR